MYSYSYFENILRLLGYKDDQNICEFWFGHLDDINTKVNQQMKSQMDRFGLEVRWKSSFGIICNEAVRKFINEKQRQHWGVLQGAVANGHPPPLVKLDFSHFQFFYDNKTVNLEEFANVFPTSKFGGCADFRGINLSEITIQYAEINNANFAYANFTNSRLIQVMLYSVNFVSADLRGSHIFNVTLAEKSSIRDADLRGTFVNILRGVNDFSVAEPFRIEPVSALYLIGVLTQVLFTERKLFFLEKGGKHTKFLANDVSALNAPANKKLRGYINWYQYVFSELDSLPSQSIKDKILFSLSIVMTKAWSSGWSLAVTGLVVNLIFALIFSLNHTKFVGLDDNYISSFYYSIVTFTTLGYGDITPQVGWAKLLVVIEVVLGYLTLGMFVYLLSRKISDKF